MTARQIPAYLILSALLVLTWASLARGEDPAPAPDPLSQLSIQQFFIDGGTIGYIIAGLSLAMVALMFEHMLSIRRGTLMPSGLAEESHRLIMAGQFKQAEELCRSRPSFLGYLLAAGLAEIGIGYAAAEKAMEDAAVQQSSRLQRKVEYLSIIGTIAPMLGLMGTVWGMILAFMEFEKKANPQVSELAPGVYKALVTTLFGLIVAIPATAAYAYFRNRIDELVAQTSLLAEHVFADYKRGLAARRKARRAQAVSTVRPAAPPAGQPPRRGPQG